MIQLTDIGKSGLFEQGVELISTIILTAPCLNGYMLASFIAMTICSLPKIKKKIIQKNYRTLLTKFSACSTYPIQFQRL